MEKPFWKKAIWIYLAVYVAVSLLFLTRFPMMHSDESWLSGLSRAILINGLSTPEPFFNLQPSYPNAVSIVFNLLQIAFISIFGYSLFAVRLISLIFGVATLLIFYRLINFLTGSVKKSLAATVILSLDIQFITASHVARQDIIITFGMIAALYCIISRAETWNIRCDILTGALVGIIVGIHPNGLMAAACAGTLYLYYIGTKRMRFRNLLILIAVVLCFAGIYIGASFLMDKDFLPHYMAFGATLGVGGSLAEKLRALPNYFLKLYLGVSGTYYIPPIRLQLIGFAAAITAAAIYTVFRREMLRFLLPVIAVVAAVVVIGRYSQPAVVILFPLCYLLVFVLLGHLPVKITWSAASILAAALFVQSVIAVKPYLNNDYSAYLQRIESVVPENSKVLANLNAEYAFDSGMLLDYRNLQYLEDMAFDAYILGNQIEYIIYPEEMDYIFDNRPVWNILYGNLYPYYGEMKAFLNDACTLMDEFESPYAMRISGYSYRQIWIVKIYKVTG